MPVQNLVSATLTPEKSSATLQKLTEVGADLDFLIVLEPDSKNEFVKVGNTYSGFLKKANGVAADHPEILPAVFNLDEFKKDYQLALDLQPILTRLKELTEAVQDTIFAANSDALSAGLGIYAAVQQNKDKIPGMDTIAAEMAAFFKRPKRKTASAAS
jgi:hypothetical protein